MNTIHLHGCRAEPLLSYLSGLGVIRLLAEQLDSDVSARWTGENLVLSASGLDSTKLIEFLSKDYRPTPLIAPWNGRGGFQDGQERPSERIVRKVEFSDSERLAPYRGSIRVARDVWEVARGHGLIEDGKIPAKHKPQFVELCRAMFPDEALAWLDASVVLLDNATAFPLMLGGAGGVIGSLDASFTFLKNLDDLGMLDERIDEQGRQDGCVVLPLLLRHALFRDAEARLRRGSAGQFDPGGVGGPNSSSIGDGAELVNPWSFVLAMEGAIVFASAASRRLSAGSQTGARMASMPFTVTAAAAEFGSASDGESPRGEIWVPLWRDELSYREIRHLISEGRCQWGRSQARSALDFVRATATLGVDRSVDEFSRYLISVRHGQNVMAVPIGRFKTSKRVRPEADVLRQLDHWVDLAQSNRAPAAVSAGLNALHRAQFAAATFGGAGRLQTVLAALAEAEQAASRSTRFRSDRRLDPVRGLLARDWVPLLDDHSAEFRIAVGLASLHDASPQGKPTAAEAVRGSLATFLRPVNRGKTGLTWADRGPRVPNLGHRPLSEILSDVVGARAALASSIRPDDDGHDDISGLPFAFRYGLSVDLADIGQFLYRQLDERRLGDILAGLLLLEWRDPSRGDAGRLVGPHGRVARLHAASHPIYAVLAPYFTGRLPVAPTDLESKPNRSIAVRPRPEWIGAIRAGTAHTAARSAAQLLRGRGWRLIPSDFKRNNADCDFLAAALLLRLDRTTGDQRQLRFLLEQQSTVDARRPASREDRSSHHEQA